MKTSFAAALAFAAAVVLGWPEPSAAYDFFYDQNCAQCHGPTRTCSGCHAHGAHGLANKQDMNVVATANKASFTAGEEVVVTVTAGYRCGWVRMLLLDGQMATLAESSGAGGLGNGADSCTPGGITLRAPAPSAPGRYTWYAAWYGNTYDLDDRTTGAVAAFGQNFRSGPGVNHGRELVPLTVTVAAGGAPAAALAPTSLAFPRVKVGATAPLSARIQNTGTAVLKVTGVTRCDDAAAAPFSWSLATPLSIAPGGEATLPVTYQPTAAASSTSCLRLATNDPANPALQLGVTGAADPASPGVPGVALSASTLSFGTGVLAGTYATRTFDVQSVGTANLDVTGIAPCDGTTAGMFTFTSPLPGTIAPAEARTVTVSYTPTAAGTHSGCLTVATSAGPIDVRLSGAATMPAVTCTSCHGGTANATGAPPTDTHGETAASRRGVGAHTAHLNTQMSPTTARQSADCTACHQAVPSFTSPLHRDGSTDVPFGGVAKGGGLNPSWNPQTPTCGTVYCHGATLADGTNTAPTWTSVGVGEAACGRCHGVPPAGNHPAVTGGLTACVSCHPETMTAAGTLDPAGKHINGLVETAGCTSCHGSSASPAPPADTHGSAATTSLGVGAHQQHVTANAIAAPLACTECHGAASGTYTSGHSNGIVEVSFGALSNTGVSSSWNRAATTCATYCHGGANTPLKGGAATAPVWTKVDGTQASCGSCHGFPPPAPHSQSTACDSCHPATVKPGGAIDLAGGKHLDGVVQFDTSKMTCSGCHGTPGRTGADPLIAAAPPNGTNGETATTARAVGAHLAHLQPGTLSKAYACTECHNPPTAMDHANGVVEMSFGPLAKGTGAPVFNGTSCASTYCHGSFTNGNTANAPTWTGGASQVGCTSCHGSPPAGTHPANTACGNCHPGSSATSVDPVTHADGNIDILQTCTSCHGTTGVNAAPPKDTKGQTATTLVSVGAHQAHAATTLRAPIACAECHGAAVASYTNTHPNSTVEMSFGALSNSLGGATVWNRTAATCASNGCHGGVAALKGGTATTPVWTKVDGTQKTCGSCHGNPPPASSGHVQRPDCGSCHAGSTNASVNLATHLNGVIDYPAQTCTSCHGSASAAYAAVAGADANVKAAPPIDTKNGTAITAAGVGVHQVHVNGARSKPVACAECHAGAVPPSTQPIHANGTTTVAFGALSKTGGVAPAYTTPALTCASTYCHGNFAGGAGAAATPAWVAAGTLGCASCHGNPPALPHPQDIACADCHGAGYTTTTVNAATHVDGLVTLPTAAHPAGSCAACHGDATKTVIAAADANANAAPPIGTRGETATSTKAVGVHTAHLNQTTYRATPIACSECHAVPVAGDKLHANGAAAVAFGTLSKTGAVTPSYNTTALTCASTYCHGNFKNGNTGAAPSWTAAGSITCVSCHGSPPSGTHPVGAACGDCHTGYTATTVNAAIHLNGILDPPSGMHCASCHGDVARTAVAGGDTLGNLRSGPPNDAKGNSLVTARGVGVHQVHVAGSRSKPQLCSECHVVPTSMTHSDGVPQVALSRSGTYDATALTCASTYCHGNFTGGAGAAATPAWTAAGTLGCASCHGNPPALPHPQDIACADCHGAGYTTTTVNAATHIDGLVTLPTAAHPAGSCAACHGDATKTVIASADANAKAAPPIGTRGETATSTKAVGAHAAHLNQTTFRPAPVSCGECHAVPAAGDKTHGNNALSMPFGTLARTGGAAATYNATTLSCATVYCHGGAGGTVSVQAGAASTPSWTGTFTPGASSLNCGSCHPALPTANAHPQRPDCGTCHAGATATAYNSASHLNGVIDVLPLGCAMCHGNASVVAVTGADLNIQASPPLDTKGNGGTTAVGVGVHQAHVNTTRAKPVACAACHAGAVPTVMQHANGVVTVAFAGVSTTGGVVPSYQPAGGSCAATYCHGNFTGGAGSIATPAWISAGTLGCASCHGNPPTANGHPQDAACADCHGAGYSTTTVNAATHVDGLVTLPTAAHPAGTCTACHGDATKTVIAAAEPNAKAAPPISSKGETTTAQRGVGAHAAHLDQTTFRGTPVACAECHPAVPAGDRTHANGTAAIAFGAAATYRGAAPAWNAASLSCASVYCHGNFTLGNGNGAGGGTATAPTAAPTGVAFSGVAANSLGLSWAAVTGATSYKVERAPNNAGAAGTFVQVGTASATSYADAGLAASTTYWYRVRATNGAGDGPYSASASQATTAAGTGTVAAPTAAPTGVAFSAAAANSLTVGWSTVAGATAYKVERAPNNAGAAGTFVQIGTAAGTSYADAGLTASTTYWYRVRATNDGGNGPYSANASQATAAASTGTGTGTATRYDLAPATATSVGTDGSTTVTAQTTYDYNNPAQTFRALGVAGYTQSSTQGRLRASTALSANTTYTVVNLYTPALTATNGTVAANMPVSIDSYVRTGASNSTATIRAVLYEYNGTTGNVGSAKGTYTSPSINTSSTTSTFTTLTGTIPNAAFTVAAGNRLKVVFQVVTGSTGGNDVAILFGAARSGTNGQTFITPTLGGSTGTTPTAPGAAPTTLAFTNVAQTTLSLGWSAVTGATHYKVERAPNLSGAPGTFAQVGTTATASFGDAGLAANTTYWYRVRAWNAGGDGPYSANASQTTTAPAAATPPTVAPTTLAFGSATPTALSLSWAAVSGATHYKVERAPDLSGAPGTFAQVGTTATASYGDAGLTANTRYWYRVRAWNAGGDGPYSANASQTTSAVAPPAGGISWTGAFTPGTSSLNCQSCHGMPPAGTHPTLTAGTNCGGCHAGYNAVAGATTGAVHPTNHLNAAVDPMPPGTEPTAATTSCGGCHGTILNAMNGTTAKASKHTLGTDASADAAVSWTGTNLAAVATTGRSCTTMCHADHPHGTTTHNANVYADATTQTTRAAAKLATDFDATQASGGLCTSCHQKPVDAANPAQKPSVAKADYQGKAHDFVQNVVGTTTNTWQYTLHDSVGAFQRNCTKCHASQAEGQTPTVASNNSGNVGPHASDFGQLLAGNTNPGTTPASFVCYNCHGDNTTGKNLSGKVLVTDAAKAQGHGGVMNSSATHDRVREAAATYNSGAYSGTNRHANCLDCHDEHKAGKTRHTPGTATTNQIAASSPLYGASGVGYTGTMPANWAAIPSANLVRVATATAEYQICFKCHTGWAFGTTPPTGPSTLAETDLAQEFNVNNKSVHPVVNTLAAQTGSTAKGLVASQLLAPWNTSPGAQTMTCSDCHNSDAASPAAQGPHGSAVRFMLSGTNKAWPYTVAGATSGTAFRVATSETGLGTANGLFCRNCHPQQNSTGSNSLHRNSNVTGGQHGSSSAFACTGCHVRIPHGGKVSRLLVTTNAPARYKVGTPIFSSITKGATKDSYSTSGFPTGFARGGCSQHSSTAGAEAW